MGVAGLQRAVANARIKDAARNTAAFVERVSALAAQRNEVLCLKVFDSDLQQIVVYRDTIERNCSQPKGKIDSLTKELNIVNYYDFSTEEAFMEIGLDKSTDWGDDIHLNANGARKYSQYLASLLKQEGMQPNAKADQMVWEKRIKDFYGN